MRRKETNEFCLQVLDFRHILNSAYLEILPIYDRVAYHLWAVAKADVNCKGKISFE